jgi:hypothetical protein
MSNAANQKLDYVDFTDEQYVDELINEYLRVCDDDGGIPIAYARYMLRVAMDEGYKRCLDERHFGASPVVFASSVQTRHMSPNWISR